MAISAMVLTLDSVAVSAALSSAKRVLPRRN
jgi:hypothetical protein